MDRRSVPPILAPRLAQYAVDNVRDAIAVLLRNGPVLTFGYVNPGFRRMFGYTASEVIGQPVGILSRAPLRSDGLLRLDFDTKNPHRGEALLKTKSGEDVLVEIDIQNVESDELEAGVLVMRDVTEYRRLEQIAAASEVSESVGYVLAGIRHELGNPLNSLKAALMLLSDPLVDLPPPRRTNYIQRALGEVKRMELLLEQLRTFNANETVDPSPIRVRNLLERFVRLVHQDCTERATSIELVPGDDLTILADSRVLHQILLLLLTNALDALDQKEDRRIRVGCDMRGPYCRIWMSDNGSGMTAEQLSNAQRPFVTTKRKGTGLGLPLAHRYANLTKCRLELTSAPGEGTQCTLEFEQINSSAI